MRKITLLSTATLLSAALLGSQGITVQAASARNNQLASYVNSKQFSAYGNRIIISNDLSKLQEILDNAGVDCDIESILKDRLENLPSQLPCPPVQLPDADKPGTETPDNKPETDTPNDDVETPDNKPDTDKPGTETPDTPPETDKPDAEAPDSNPDTDKPGTGTPDNKPDTDKPETDRPTTENQAYINRVVELVNIERAKEGLAPLSVDLNVQAAAQVRALEIERSFSHTRPNGTNFSTALKEQNVTYRSAGENIAWGQRSPEEVVKGWMSSPGHRANIMDKGYTKIGVGYHQNARGTNYWSQLFI